MAVTAGRAVPRRRPREGGFRGGDRREGGYQGGGCREGGFRGGDRREGGYRRRRVASVVATARRW